MCFMRHGNSVVTNCTADDLAPALKRVLHISYQFMTQESPIGGIPEITYEGCECKCNINIQPTRVMI